jgi:hypothetical protein
MNKMQTNSLPEFNTNGLSSISDLNKCLFLAHFFQSIKEGTASLSRAELMAARK